MRQRWIFKEPNTQDQRIWKEPTERKSEIIRNMEPEKYSNNTKTTACDVRRLYNGEQTQMHAFNSMGIWAQVDRFCDAKAETRKSVNLHSSNNQRWFTNSAEKQQRRQQVHLFGFSCSIAWYCSQSPSSQC